MSELPSLIDLTCAKLRERGDDGRFIHDPRMPLAELEGYGLTMRWVNTLEAAGIMLVKDLTVLDKLYVRAFRDGGEEILATALQNFIDGSEFPNAEHCSVLPVPMKASERTEFEAAASRRGQTIHIFALEAMREAAK